MIKAMVGYTLMPGMTPETYDEWLWSVHVPDLLANPYLDKIVFNTVLEPVAQASGDTAPVGESLPLYRIAELHFASIEAYRQYRAWFADHPIPVERGPQGRTDFKFYLLCAVTEATR
ncbi:MAG: EthD domain-containing protein, partial [Dehalococcoidia bacterium]|nr:EthD domain-containing protein [Dehalococcoidia bacterium]